MFAMITGFLTLSYYFLARIIGNIVNKFVGVTKESLSDLWKLFLIQAIAALIPLAFVWLLPNRAQVEVVQNRIQESI